MAGNHITSIPIPHGQEVIDRKREEDERSVVWVFLWTLLAFKLATVALIIWASKSFEAGVLVSATTWPFLVIPAMALAGPILYHYRLRRVRARRKQLLRSEWMLD
jgi:hypothetical protein